MHRLKQKRENFHQKLISKLHTERCCIEASRDSRDYDAKTTQNEYFINDYEVQKYNYFLPMNKILL